MEFDVVKPLKSILYKCYVDDIYSKRITNQQFLDSEIMIKNGIIETSVVLKEYKIPNHWSSAVPKKYKRNAILGDLLRAHKISNNFELEKQHIKKKYLCDNFLYNFIQSAFNSYQQKCE